MKILILFVLFLFNVSCGNSPLGGEDTEPPSHDIFDSLLSRHVDKEGLVDYRGFIADKEEFKNYLQLLSQNPPDRDTWSREEQLAYWINAYNAFTIKLIIDHYPVESIRDIGPLLDIPLVNTVWHLEFFEIGGQPASLDEIEHKILRKEFDEPRIHFAINCASVSCPKLLNRAFRAEKMEAQLEKVSKEFINDPNRNELGTDSAEISSIFSWFEEDFTTNGSLIDFLNQYAETPLHPSSKISYRDYDWSLNE
ncbi:DUF547 domain-containing protein [Cyclobacterium jeungdonense]|uniref:DUF547 domain-containing protein n=1 Tax=Cyclobacterium jeungdonense TaxID=708087 RepID=A0ABT8CCU0_9BACT|nr:DUF547 domain-containing protein [Cyclobacterium jeungdonense]MDN3689613.1 DUF547 domain-containing protein [Cyclobacterium jeungdonense]